MTLARARARTKPSATNEAYDWISWSWVFEKLGSGVLQGIGGLAVWLLLILWILHSGWGSSVLQRTMASRSPGLANLAEKPVSTTTTT
jgi:hypothetical protein